MLGEFRSHFVGKVSPVHFFWGSMDLACTRFSGREAPEHPGGAPNCGDWVMVEGYSRELSSAGFWPGGGEEGAFYAYAYPEPDGFADYPVAPEAAYYSAANGQFLLPYEAVADVRGPGPDAVASSCTPPTGPPPTWAAGTGRPWRTTRPGGRSIESRSGPDPPPRRDPFKTARGGAGHAPTSPGDPRARSSPVVPGSARDEDSGGDRGQQRDRRGDRASPASRRASTSSPAHGAPTGSRTSPPRPVRAPWRST